ncbi:MAG: CopG family transcriptional regulator [Pseudomonadota bacterium]|jgi:RHH-type rel operon transcriptional repressor/antitoxin RelB|nr:CopG family transcriptional regulator [Pseudomonadota bacterium]
MPTSIQLDDKTERRLEKLAVLTGRTKAHLLRKIIAGGLDELEEAALAAVTLKRVRIGREKVYTAGEVRTELGLNESTRTR